MSLYFIIVAFCNIWFGYSFASIRKLQENINGSGRCFSMHVIYVWLLEGFGTILFYEVFKIDEIIGITSF